MISNNNKTNINNNKYNVDRMGTQMTTQKKIYRPSEDPVIAIRALRLRDNLNVLNQYYEKNIPDAESWLGLTDTALGNMQDIMKNVYEQCVYGSNGTLTGEDRASILQNLQALRDQVYAEGNADYAERSIFTGYKTNSNLTFGEDEPDTLYEIKETLSVEDIQEKKYYTNELKLPTTLSEVQGGIAQNLMASDVPHNRMRLSYSGLNGTDGSTTDVTISASGLAIQPTVTTMSYNTWAQSIPTGYPAPPANDAYFIPETGELILGEDLANNLRTTESSLDITYTKEGFASGEVRPEHYFDCTNKTPTLPNEIPYKLQDQEIKYTVAFNQEIVVNTQMSDVLDASVGRDIDELTDIVKSSIAAHEKIAKIDEMLASIQYADPVSQAGLAEWREAAVKEADYYDNNMQKTYESYISKFQGYRDDITLARTDVGNKLSRLELTKNRVSSQIDVFEDLKSTNEDREISDIIIDYTATTYAYQQSLLAASKASEQSLLNYI
jgi:flagellar hook-associated protein 3 FlgL